MPPCLRILLLLAALLPATATAATEAVSFPALADTYVDGASPTSSFGGATLLKADASPVRIIYLRFAVTGLRGRPVQQARLRLGVAGTSPETGGTVHRITATPWDESTLTYATRPPVDGPALATLGPVPTAGASVEFVLDGAIDGEGVYEFAIDSPSTSSVAYHSSSSTSGPPPTLLLTLATGPAPAVSIAQPQPGSTFFVGDPITLAGVASDAADGDLSGAIRWLSDLDGALGTGSVVTTALREGRHAVTASVTNRGGVAASARLDVVVVPRPTVNTEPLVAITAPLDAQTVIAGQPVRFTGTAHDLEDGDLSAALAWASDRDGALGTGASLSRALGAGTHRISARVADRSGLAGGAAITVVAVPPDTVTLVPVADAAVDAGAPSANAGASPLLRVDASVVRITYLRFVVQGLAGQRVAGARLRLQVDAASGAASPSGGTLRALTNHAWQESTVTYANRPAVDGPVLAAIGPVVAGRLADLDLGTAVTGDGTYDFALVGDSSDEADYRSRETATPPTLVLTLAGRAPTVTIVAPAPGTVVLAGEPVACTGAASDPEDGGLTGRLRWTSSLDGPLGTGGSIQAASLRVGTHTLTAAATDADGRTGRATVTLRVRAPNQPPTVTITAPADGARLFAGTSITLAATTTDDEDTDLAGRIEWTSSRDGALGTGATRTAALSEGTHTLTAVVTDSGGLVGRAQRTVVVRPPNLPPALAIRSPADGTALLATRAALLAAGAVDPEDGDLGAAIRWTSSRDGVLGTGASLTVATLSPGTHTLTASVTDRDGATASARASVTVAPATLTFLPVADTYVDAASPSSKYGTNSGLLAGTSPVRQAFLRFAVQGVAPFAVERALLRLTVGTGSSDGSASGGAVHRITSGTWAEATTSYATRPPIDGSALATRAKVSSRQMVDFDVTAALAGDGRYDFALDSSSTDPVRYQSREASAKPQLIVTLRQNLAPVVTITAPAAGTVVVPGAPVTFAGRAVDAESGDLGARLAWASSLDGPLGTGPTLGVSTLRPGTHVITARVTDAGGATGQAETTVVVRHPPAVTITGPADGTVRFATQPPVALTGTALDDEDGDLTARLAWRSSLDGPLGSGPAVTAAALRIGTHVITARVVDADGVPGQAQITLRVRGANVRPTLVIGALPRTVPAGTPVVLSATASDDFDGDLSAGVQWASNRDGPLGNGGSRVLSEGKHTLTATVTDSDGASASASAAITVTPTPPVVTITAPSADTAVVAGSSVAFTATALDATEGDLSALLRWASDRDGPLGTGATVSVSTLSAGTHLVTATATDTGGLAGHARRTVLVNVAPVVTIATPLDGATLVAGRPVQLGARATDAEDGDLGTTLRWTSSRDGALGSGPQLITRTLSPGTHALTASATDRQGAVASVTVTVTLVAATLRFPVLADTTVDAGHASTRYGTSTKLIAGTGPVRQALLRFAVSGVAPLTVERAFLRLTVGPGSGDGSKVATTVTGLTTHGWSEATTTWATRPPVDGPLIATGPKPVAPKRVLDLDVTRAVPGDGPVDLALGCASSDFVTYLSRESSAGRPELVVTLGQRAPAVAILQPEPDAVVLTGTPVTFFATAFDEVDGEVGATLVWTSDRDGVLGRGVGFSTSALSAGTHTVTATAVNGAGMVGTASVRLTVPPAMLTFTPTADTYTDQAFPSTNFGTAVRLAAGGGSAIKNAFLRFPVTGLGAFQVADARLELVVGPIDTASGGAGGTVRRITNTTWSETAVTYLNQPKLDGPVLDTISLPVVQGDTVSFRVGAAVTRDGVYNFAITSNSRDAVKYQSREGLPPPRLLVALRQPPPRAPRVTITTPAATDVVIYDDETVPLKATAFDASDGLLTGAITWSSNRAGVLGGGGSISGPRLGRGTHVVTASVRNRAGLVGTAAVIVRVLDRPPAVVIQTPTDGQLFPIGFPVTFTAAAADDTDGDLSGGLAWASDRDGPLGTGPAVTTSMLSAGDHRITATVTNASGTVSGGTITVTIANATPRLTIGTPTNGATVADGSPVTLTATATDLEDGDLTSAITWVSSVQGALGTGGTIAPVLTGVGSHVLTASITDSGGLTNSVQRTVQVVTAPPALVITSPADGSTIAGPLTLTGQAYDLHTGDRSAAIQWTSSVSGILGRGASLTVPRPAFGRHLLTARVSNSDGLVTTRSIAVVIGNLPPRVTIDTPANAASVPGGLPVVLRGSATDASDGDLSASLRWYSDLDGPLASGATITVPQLSPGTHRITAQVADARGLTGRTEILLLVGASRSVTPQVTITAPGPDAMVEAGSPVVLAGTAVAGATDLSAKLVWVSDLAGVLGTGPTVSTRELFPGTHRITALARDQAGPIGRATRTLTVSVPVASFPAAADAWTDQLAPAATLGSTSILLADDSPVRRIYLRFDVSALPAGPIERAVVRLHTTAATSAASDQGGELRAVSGPWDESTIDHLTKPPMDGALLSSVGAVTPAQTVDFDVTPAIVGEGTYSFGIRTRSSNGVEYVAREGGPDGPVLHLFPMRPAATGAVVDITAPTAGATLAAGVRATFTATATDPQDGDISPTLVWVSDRDGVLGTGPQIGPVLSPGTHLVTAIATESSGHTAADVVEVTVGSEGPAVTIDRPASGTTVALGQPIAFVGTAADGLDGDLGPALTWTSSLDGPLGTGPSLVRTLRAGTHTVTAAVTSRTGTRASASVTVQVTTDRVGSEDFGFGPNIEVGFDKATATKPQSKLWYQDGIWWATLFVQSKSAYRIHRLDLPTQTWVDTGVLVDERGRSRQDVLLEGETLYMVSRFGFAGAAPPVNRLLRFTYYPGAQTYALDPGFPVAIPGGGAEAVTLARDASGTLWIAYLLEGTLYAAHTTGSDTQWSLPFTPPVPEGRTATTDDDAAVITMPDGGVGIFWSNQITDKFYFVTHAAGAPDLDPLAWRLEVVGAGQSIADDHFNLKLAADGRLFVAAKTSRQTAGATLVGLFVRSPAGTWSPLHKVTNVDYEPTRPLCVLDEARRRVYVVYSSFFSDVYYKASDMDALAFDVEGVGTPLMVSGTHPDPLLVGGINDPSGTKQTPAPSAGLPVLASTSETSRYWHNWLVPPLAPPMVGITAPVEGLRVPAGTPITLTAVATSTTDGVITPRLTWTSSLDGTLGGGPSVTTAGLSVGVHHITAAATDSTTLTGRATVTVTVVPDQAPIVHVVRPEDEQRLRSDRPIVLAATAVDTFGVDRSSTLVWTSDRDGLLGMGGSVTHAPLAPGRHTITAAAADDAGRVGSMTVAIEVLEPSPPVITLLAPVDGALLPFGAPASFVATAVDPFDGDLGDRLLWTSNRDGAIGTGASFARSTLSRGPHVITVTAGDSVGLTASASASVTVGDEPAPAP